MPKRGHRRHLGRPAGRLGRRPTAITLRRGPRPGRGGRAHRQGADGGAASWPTLLAELRALIDAVAPGDLVAGGGRAHRLPGRAGGRAQPRGRRAHRERRRAGRGGRRVRGPDRVPGDGGPRRGLRRARQRRHPGQPHDPAHGQGPRVPGRVPGRAWRTGSSPTSGRSASRSSSRRSGGSATSASPGPGAHLYLSHAWVRTLWGTHRHNIPCRFLSEVPDRAGPRRRVVVAARARTARPGAWSRGPAVGGSADGPTGPEAGRVFGAGLGPPPGGRPGDTGAEALGLAAGDTVVHDRWGQGVVVSAEGGG